jgi:uncharacterized protein YbdZ (MbtH family)
VYENINTEERQAWFPEEAAAEEVAAPLVPAGAAEGEKDKLKEANKKALEAFRKKREAQKKEEAEMPVPEGWKRVESRSRPGEMVYENTITGERQAWFPDGPATKDDATKARLEQNKKALEARKARKAADALENASKPLPEGWKMVESRSRPGEFVYENIYTEERQAWFPTEPATQPLPAGWRRVESRTYPGEYVYENVYTLDRQAWVPTEPATNAPQEASPEKRTADQLARLAGAKASAPSVICKARAIYEYATENPDEEIDLLEGDVIAVEFKADNGWWVGLNTRTERTGIFPGSYVEEM